MVRSRYFIPVVIALFLAVFTPYTMFAGENGLQEGTDAFPDYPAYSDRQGWNAFFGDRAESFIKQGEKWIDYKYEYVPASVYLAFETGGDRSSFQADNTARTALEACILAELAEGRGRFLRCIVDGVWYFSEKISWVHPQHAKRKSTRRSLGDPDEEIIGITSSFTGVDVAYAYHFFKEEWDKIDPSISKAALKALDTHIFRPFLDERLTDSNWWLGFTPGMPIINWCPWINFDCMLAAFLTAPESDTTARMLERSLRSMRGYMAYLRPDGGCDEGPSYWAEASGKVFDYVYLLTKATGSSQGIVSQERLRKMGEYLTDIYIGDGWVVSHADGFARTGVNSVFLYRYGDFVGSDRMKELAMLRYSETPSGDIFNRFEFNRICDSYRACHEAFKKDDGAYVSTLGDAWYPDNDVAVMRRGDWYLFTLGHNNYAGPRNDTHNHDDVGEFVLFYDNMPVFIDMGKSTPTNGTYDKERYTFFHIRSNSHNVPAINGVEQGEGAERKASNVNCSLKQGRVSMDIQNAYGPEACARKWHRDFSLSSNGCTLTEDFKLERRTGSDLFRFMTRGEVENPSPGTVRIKIHDFDSTRFNTIELRYPQSLMLNVENIALDDPTFSEVWGPELKQLIFKTAADAPCCGRITFKVTGGKAE